MPVRVRSFSKINLGLRIGPVRPDGYHGLSTVYQTVGLHDVVTVSARRAAETRIVLRSNHPGVPPDGRNTAWKMVELALGELGVAAEVEIEIEKRLPVQGGMGAGSANAAAALIGLEKELNLQLTPEARLRLGALVGSDVPLFFVGGASLGSEHGEVVEPYPDFAPTACVMAVPGVGVSTAAAFKEWDKKRADLTASGALTPAEEAGRLEELSRAYVSAFLGDVQRGDAAGASGVPGRVSSGEEAVLEGDLARDPLSALVRTGIANDFEEVVFSQHPFLRDILHALRGESEPEDERAVMAMLSGSGASLFGLYRTEAAAEAARRRVEATGTKALVTTTLPRDQYWQSMLEQGS